MYLNRISISGKKMECPVVNLSEECPFKGHLKFRRPFRTEVVHLSPDLRETHDRIRQRQHRLLQ